MKSNYELFFGSPEQVAITFATIGEWTDQVVRLSEPPEGGGKWFAPTPYYLLGESIGADLGENATEFLEWLRCDAE